MPRDLCPQIAVLTFRCAKDSRAWAGATRKPNSVPEPGSPESGNDHSSRDDCCQPPLATYPGARTGRSQALPYLVLHRVGFTKLLRSPGELVRSYRTFSPLPDTRSASGGILSVALSFTSPRLHVMEHPALRCSDFPPGYGNNPAIVWIAPAISARRQRLLKRAAAGGC